jgi:hypothetical protein
MKNTFTVGKTYTARSICDRNCIWSFTVTARTAKTVTLSSDDFTDGAKSKRFRPRITLSGDERILPLGNYSMAPAITA